MKVFDTKSGRGAKQMRHIAGIILVAALSIASVAPALADSAPPAGVPTEEGMRVLALQWYLQMQAGKIDRTQYAPAYGAQLTDDAVQGMSHYLNQYGASPTRAEIMQERSVENQTFYLVKLIFPRGDAASLLFGFDTEGKIMAVGLESMAGD
jgi:hypothetical protein